MKQVEELNLCKEYYKKAMVMGDFYLKNLKKKFN